jgi:hypothetical protein
MSWFRTNHFEEAVSAIEAAADFSEAAVADPYRWKWVVIAVHGAVQAFMVLALYRGNGLLAMPDALRDKWLEKYRAGEVLPMERMDSFLNLYKKVKTDAAVGWVHSKRFVPGPTQDASMRQLNKFRNEFIHFMPKVWSLELAGLPAICLDCLFVARFLHGEGGNILWHKAEWRERAERAFDRAEHALACAATEYQKRKALDSAQLAPAEAPAQPE